MQPISRDRRKQLYIACIILCTGLFSIDMYNPALPRMVQSLQLTAASLKGLSTYYLAGFAISQLIYGPLSDSYGRKPIIIASLLLTVTGNIATAFCLSAWQLQACRLLTGLGAGGCPVISRAIIRDTFEEKKALTSAFTTFAMFSQISPAFAPMLGGVIVSYYSWQGIFVGLAAITLLSALLVFSQLTETQKSRMQFTPTAIWRQYTSAMCVKGFLGYSLLSAIVFCFSVGYYTFSPFVYQHTYHLSAAKNGSIYIFYCLCILTGAFFTKKILRYLEPETLIFPNILLFLLLSITLRILCVTLPNIKLFITLTSLFGLLCGSIAPLLITLALIGCKKSQAGAASALQGSLKMLGSAIILYLLAHSPSNSPKELSSIFLILAIAMFGIQLSILMIPKMLISKLETMN